MNEHSSLLTFSMLFVFLFPIWLVFSVKQMSILEKSENFTNLDFHKTNNSLKDTGRIKRIIWGTTSFDSRALPYFAFVTVSRFKSSLLTCHVTVKNHLLFTLMLKIVLLYVTAQWFGMSTCWLCMTGWALT